MKVVTEPKRAYRNAAVLYFWRQCGHCRTFAPIFQQVLDALQQEHKLPHVTVYTVEVMDYKDKLTEYNVDLGDGVPRLILYDSDGQPLVYEGERTFADVKRAMEGYLGATPHAGMAGGGIRAVADDPLDAISVNPASVRDNTLVLYYSPTCGFCRAFAPTYLQFKQQAAQSMPGLHVVAVNVKVHKRALKELPAEVSSKTVPHVVYRKSGTTMVPFQQRRTVDKLMQFVQQHSAALAGGRTREPQVTAPTRGSIADMIASVVRHLRVDVHKYAVLFAGWSRQPDERNDRLYILLLSMQDPTVYAISGKRKGPLTGVVVPDPDPAEEVRRRLRANYQAVSTLDDVHQALKRMGFGFFENPVL